MQLNRLLVKYIIWNFASRLKELRIDKGLTRQQMADKLFVSVRLISYWENGLRECDFDMLIKIAGLLGVTVDYLLGRVNYF